MNKIILYFITISVVLGQWPSPKFGNKPPIGILLFTGLNQASIVYNDSNTQNSTSTNPLIALHFGIEKSFDKNIVIGVRHTIRGIILSEFISGTNKYNYLNSYLYKSFNLIEQTYFHFGIEMGILLGGQFDSTICDVNECVGYEEVSAPIDFGIPIGFGIKANNIDCRLTYYHGLRDVIDRTGFSDNLNFKHRDFQILFGYYF